MEPHTPAGLFPPPCPGSASPSFLLPWAPGLRRGPFVKPLPRAAEGAPSTQMQPWHRSCALGSSCEGWGHCHPPSICSDFQSEPLGSTLFPKPGCVPRQTHFTSDNLLAGPLPPAKASAFPPWERCFPSREGFLASSSPITSCRDHAAVLCLPWAPPQHGCHVRCQQQVLGEFPLGRGCHHRGAEVPFHVSWQGWKQHRWRHQSQPPGSPPQPPALWGQPGCPQPWVTALMGSRTCTRERLRSGV